MLTASPQLKLFAALVGAAISAFVTEPGRYQWHRAAAAGLLTAFALFLTYGGATLFSYTANHAPIYPGQPAPQAAPTQPSVSISPSPATSPTPQPTARAASISVVSPDNGSAAGGDTVTITGTGFTDVTGVQFGDVSAQEFTRISDTQITTISPPGMGTVDIVVISAGNPTGVSVADQFSYVSATPTPTPTPTPTLTPTPTPTPTS